MNIEQILNKLPSQPKSPVYTGIVKGGYAAAPGTGPTGERCQTCKHYLRLKYANVYRKCGLTNWTNGDATTIRARSPACNLWEALSVHELDNEEELRLLAEQF